MKDSERDSERFIDEFMHSLGDAQKNNAGVWTLSWPYEESDDYYSATDLMSLHSRLDLPCMEVETCEANYNGETWLEMKVPAWLLALKMQEMKQKRISKYWQDKAYKEKEIQWTQRREAWDARRKERLELEEEVQEKGTELLETSTPEVREFIQKTFRLNELYRRDF